MGTRFPTWIKRVGLVVIGIAVLAVVLASATTTESGYIAAGPAVIADASDQEIPMSVLTSTDGIRWTRVDLEDHVNVVVTSIIEGGVTLIVAGWDWDDGSRIWVGSSS